MLAAILGTIAVLLWAAGLPRARTVAADVFLLGYAGCILALILPPRGLRARPALRTLLQELHFAFLIGAFACTGGLHSPLLVILITVTPSLVLSGGWSWRSRVDVLVICAAAAAMALAPDAWLGPPMQPRSFAAIAALGLAAGALLLTRYVAFLATTLEEAVWDTLDAREQFAAQALARSREMEQLGGALSGPHYVAAKAGVSGLVKWCAKYGAPDGILANAVAPGLVWTPMTMGYPVPENAAPVGRVGRPEDIAQSVLFLASDMSNYITGCVLDVNGGIFMTP